MFQNFNEIPKEGNFIIEFMFSNAFNNLNIIRILKVLVIIYHYLYLKLNQSNKNPTLL